MVHKINYSWHNLKPGDIVDVVATSSAPSDGNIINGVSDYIKSLNLTPRVPDDILGEDILCANTTSDRFRHLKNVLVADDSKAVWCLKGGYGMAHLIPMLNDIPPPVTAKLVIGFSDVTALHIFLNQEWNWPTLHAPMLGQIINKEIKQESIIALQNIIHGKDTMLSYKLHPLNDIANNHKKFESKIIGGNLSLIQNSIGSPWQINSAHKILFLEDVDETTMRIHRMLTHLDQASIFNGINALILGDFTNIHDIEGAPSLEDMLAHFIYEFSEKHLVPVFRMDNIGHNDTNYPLPLNTPATIEKCVATIQTGMTI